MSTSIYIPNSEKSRSNPSYFKAKQGLKPHEWLNIQQLCDISITIFRRVKAAVFVCFPWMAAAFAAWYSSSFSLLYSRRVRSATTRSFRPHYFYGRRTKSEIITNGEIVSELHFLIRSITSKQGFGSAFFADPDQGKNLHAESRKK